MSAARTAATITRAGVVVTLTPPTSSALDPATGRVFARRPAPRTVAAADYADAVPAGRTLESGTPVRRRRFILATLDTTGAPLPATIRGWTITDASGETWTIDAVDTHSQAGVALAYEARAVA